MGGPARPAAGAVVADPNFNRVDLALTTARRRRVLVSPATVSLTLNSPSSALGTFGPEVTANEPLRTGRYGKALTLTLSTTTP